MSLTTEDILCRLQLIRSDNVGPHSFAALLARFGSAKAALAAVQNGAAPLAGATARRVGRLAGRDEAERELAYAEKIGARFIALGEADYPLYLQESDNPPPLIAVKGNSALLQRRSLAIVGSRSASAVGLRLSNLFAQALGAAGFVICSGFARGIDAQAHKAALKSGTVAVVAGGVDHIYPAENTWLYQDILAHGGVFVSEMPLGWRPRAMDFPRRNRLIAALSLGLLVIEASERSGSLITARYAAEAGRIVFAAPGSPLDPRAKGTNNLIKNGACLVDRPEDIIEILTPLTGSPPDSRAAAADITLAAAEENPVFAAFMPDHSAGAKAQNTAGPAAAGVPPPKQPDDSRAAAGAPSRPLPAENTEKQPPAAAAVKEPRQTAIMGEDLTEEEKRRLWQSLSVTPIAVDNLAQATKIPLSRLYLGLMELELAGCLVRHNGGMVSALPE